MGLPSLAFLGFAVYIAAQGQMDQRERGQRYLAQGMQSAAKGNFHAAQIYLIRAREFGSVDSREVSFALAVVWEKLGYAGRSIQLLQSLAPVNRVGYGKAHQHLAIMISLENNNLRPSNEVLAGWLWHLTHAEQQNLPELQESWGNYYLAVDDLQAAIKAYRNAAIKYPRLYLAMANLHDRLGQLELRTETLRRSEERFRERLRISPNDRNARVVYAATLLQLGELVQAEQVLRTGLRLDPDGPYKLLLAATFVQIHDRLMEKGAEYQAEALKQLRHALEFDANFGPALKRMLGYAQLEPAAIPELREMLNEILVSGKGTALAHLALSNMAWIEGDSEVAAFHLKQAMDLDSDMPVIANNLAWLLAHDEKPNLDRALEIIDDVIAKHPDNPRFLDTRGTILVKMGRSRDGLIDLEKALPGMPNKAPVHRKIAGVYREMGLEDIARSHEKLAGVTLDP